MSKLESGNGWPKNMTKPKPIFTYIWNTPIPAADVIKIHADGALFRIFQVLRQRLQRLKADDQYRSSKITVLKYGSIDRHEAIAGLF